MKLQGYLPGDVHCHILLWGAGQDPKQLIEDGWQELDHHMTLHGMQTLRAKRKWDVFLKRTITSCKMRDASKIDKMLCEKPNFITTTDDKSEEHCANLQLYPPATGYCWSVDTGTSLCVCACVFVQETNRSLPSHLASCHPPQLTCCVTHRLLFVFLAVFTFEPKRCTGANAGFCVNVHWGRSKPRFP